MNIQIFGARKSFDTKKAERWFKERRIKYQYIDLDSKGLSPAAEEKLLENPWLFRAPIVRNGRQATVGYCPDVWKTWE